MLPNPISTSQVDAKSPIDEALMGAIKADLEYLDTNQQAAGAFDYQWKVSGGLNALRWSPFTSFIRRNRIDGGLISKPTTFQECRALLEDAGSVGTLDIDVRAYTDIDAAITSIRALYTDAIQSIGRVGSSVNTQSIARTTAQIATQSIARWKASLNILSIVTHSYDETNPTLVKYMRVNLSGAPDIDWLSAQVTISGASSGANNGTFYVVGVLDDAQNAILISNASGLDQNSAAGSADLEAWKFTFTNPVSTEFAAGETEAFLAAAHTSGANNGLFSIYKINQGGNNIITRTVGPVAQAGVAGNANVQRFTYTAAAAVATDYAVDEYMLAAGHTSGANNGIFRITAVNTIANGVSVYNSLGVVQGGAAGTINTERWQYSFATDPSANVTAGDWIIFIATSSALNSGWFVVKEVNHAAGTNIVVANAGGILQGGAFGSAYTAKKKVSFAADQSSIITTDSRINITNTLYLQEDDYDVVEVNRGGGANYNAIINTNDTAEQFGAQGRVALESKSIFDTRPSLVVNPTTYNYHNTKAQVTSNMVLNATRKIVGANTKVMFDIIDVPSDAKNLTVQLL